MRALPLLATLLGVTVWTAGCYAYRTVPVAPAAGTRVRVVLTGATPVIAMVPGREDTRRTFEGVLEAGGTIQAAAGDTVALVLGELRTAAGSVPDVAGRIALLPTARIGRIEERRFQAGTTLLAGTGVSLLVFTVFIVLLTATVVKAAG
jgi:hypothetical protein